MTSIASRLPDTLSDQDLALLRKTIALSEESKMRGRHPFAALVADEHGNVICEAGNNSMPPEGDPTQHAELVAAATAARLRTPEQLARATLYTSAEPCCMCAGAIILARVPLVVWGLSDPKRGGHSVFSILNHPGLNHRPEVQPGTLEPECRAILQGFFKERRSDLQSPE